MGSQVLKLLLTTRNFWLLSPSSSSELLLPSLAMAMVDTGMVDTAEDTVAMVATEDTTTARGLLMLSLRLRPMLSPPPPPSPDMDTTAMDMDTTLTDTAMLLLTPTDIITTARGPLMLSPDMATTAVDTDMEATEATARGPLMLSPDMATTAVDTEDTMEVMSSWLWSWLRLRILRLKNSRSSC